MQERGKDLTVLALGDRVGPDSQRYSSIKEVKMAPARVYTIEEILVGRLYEHPHRGTGIVVRADRKLDADRGGEHAFAIEVIPLYPFDKMPTYWQTIYIRSI